MSDQAMDLIGAVNAVAVGASVQAYLVGGCVRDQLLKRPTKDVDVLVCGDTHAFAETLSRAVGGSVCELGSGRGMFRVVGPVGRRDEHVDVCPLAGSLEDDLRRRDFTINALAKACHENARLADPTGGLEDLAHHLVRATSSEALAADPLRSLRAVRLAAQLRFTVEPGTRSMIAESAALLRNVAAERVRDEFFLMLRERDVAGAISMLDQLGLLVVLFPEVVALKGIEQAGYHHLDAFEHSVQVVGALRETTDDPGRLATDRAPELERHWAVPLADARRRREALLLAGLLHDVGKVDTLQRAADGVACFFGHDQLGAQLTRRIASRLVLSRREEAFLMVVVGNHLRATLLAADPNAGPSALRRFRRDVGPALPDVVALAWADAVTKRGPRSSPERLKRLSLLGRHLIGEWLASRHAETPLLSGEEIMAALAIGPGPRIGELIEALADARAEGIVHSREDAVRLLKSLQATEEGAEGLVG